MKNNSLTNTVQMHSGSWLGSLNPECLDVQSVVLSQSLRRATHKTTVPLVVAPKAFKNQKARIQKPQDPILKSPTQNTSLGHSGIVSEARDLIAKAAGSQQDEIQSRGLYCVAGTACVGEEPGPSGRGWASFDRVPRWIGCRAV